MTSLLAVEKKLMLILLKFHKNISYQFFQTVNCNMSYWSRMRIWALQSLISCTASLRPYSPCLKDNRDNLDWPRYCFSITRQKTYYYFCVSCPIRHKMSSWEISANEFPQTWWLGNLNDILSSTHYIKLQTHLSIHFPAGNVLFLCASLPYQVKATAMGFVGETMAT